MEVPLADAAEFVCEALLPPPDSAAVAPDDEVTAASEAEVATFPPVVPAPVTLTPPGAVAEVTTPAALAEVTAAAEVTATATAPDCP